METQRARSSDTPSRMTIRVYVVTANGVVRPGRSKVFSEGQVDADVAANPMRYPSCRCAWCKRDRRG
ncbi:hypothetical protein [Streptomyces sp. ODS28]|uniref:hypothetical protein n=1 Tax=Streptomyces sp. ODS28 TaxID=3136688 RepID=UPI0031F16095